MKKRIFISGRFKAWRIISRIGMSFAISVCVVVLNLSILGFGRRSCTGQARPIDELMFPLLILSGETWRISSDAIFWLPICPDYRLEPVWSSSMLNLRVREL